MASANSRDIIIILLIVLPMLVGGSPAPLTLTLHRVPISPNLSEVVARDRARYELIHSYNTNGVISFPLGGTFDPTILGIYYTRLQLGTPPRDFYVVVDTGSDISWVSCPKTTGIQNISINFYDPDSSSSSSFVSCMDKRCNEMSGSKCITDDSHCHYSIQYRDKSQTSGYYVKDLLTYERVPMSTKYIAPIMFGCTTVQSTHLMRPNKAIGGIFGFGRQRESLISQLASQDLSPLAFLHCLSENGGGSLVFGVVVEPNTAYSPLMPSTKHYNLDLKYIYVNGQRLQISHSVFAKNRGVTIDSGTTLAFLPKKAYNVLIRTISVIVSVSSPQIFQFEGSHY